MPILDSEEYSLANTEYVLGVLDKLLEEEGKKRDEQHIFYFNIFLGKKFLRFDNPDTRTHVCRRMAFGHMFIILHQIHRAEVLKCSSTKTGSELDNCITVLWTEESPETSQIEAGLAFADEIMRNIELATGSPCSVPLTRQQLPNTFTFELAWLNVAEQKIRKVLITGDDHEGPVIRARDGT